MNKTQAGHSCSVSSYYEIDGEYYADRYGLFYKKYDSSIIQPIINIDKPTSKLFMLSVKNIKFVCIIENPGKVIAETFLVYASIDDQEYNLMGNYTLSANLFYIHIFSNYRDWISVIGMDSSRLTNTELHRQDFIMMTVLEDLTYNTPKPPINVIKDGVIIPHSYNVTNPIEIAGNLTLTGNSSLTITTRAISDIIINNKVFFDGNIVINCNYDNINNYTHTICVSGTEIMKYNKSEGKFNKVIINSDSCFDLEYQSSSLQLISCADNIIDDDPVNNKLIPLYISLPIIVIFIVVAILVTTVFKNKIFKFRNRETYQTEHNNVTVDNNVISHNNMTDHDTEINK